MVRGPLPRPLCPLPGGGICRGSTDRKGTVLGMFKLLDRIEEWTCVAMLFFMAILAFANVIVRYLTTFSFSFSEELLVNLFVWITMLGASIATRKGSLLGVTYLFDRMPSWFKKFSTVVIVLCGITLFGLLTMHGIDMVKSEYRSGMTTYSMALPMWIFGMAVPVCALILVLRTIQRGVQEWKGLSIPQAKTCPEVDHK